MKRIAIMKITMKPLLNNDFRFAIYPKIMPSDVELTAPPKEVRPDNFNCQPANNIEGMGAISNEIFPIFLLEYLFWVCLDALKK